MEYVKDQSYSTTNVDWDYTVTDSGRSSSDEPDWWDDTGSPGSPPLLSSNYAGYSATIDVNELEVGLQKITVTISHNGDPVITLEGYKVDR